ncbi:hypothetical protein M222_0712 [Enterococcus faecalis AZ19]|uniref:hypothetical protein n=1 Tax=Enterococcus faecalis TaxID=1351 RepID=UPI00045A9A7A|nr:hypothetical protein [Enterococcus faecalis]KAJ76009.1 hypothetical protein M222_0712 [Enterococcus faecalis AZ19]
MSVNCMRCGDMRIVYEKKDRFGRRLAEYCPLCNRQGSATAKELGSIEKRKRDGKV